MEIRCAWVKLSNPLYVKYHDQEWGKPVHDDIVHFEFILLEGAQAGLSWETILNKRAAYKKLFAGFDPKKVARFTSKKIAALMEDPSIVRNRLKIQSAVTNAKAFLSVQLEFGSFDNYIWGFVQNKPLLGQHKSVSSYASKTELSDRISKDLRNRGFKFVGTTIVYSYLQAVGIVNDHVVSCCARNKAAKTWFVYIVRCADNSLYTGVTDDLARRFNEHQMQSKKTAKYLRGKTPLQLVFQQNVTSKRAALQMEHKLKQLSKADKESLLLCLQLNK